MKMAGAFAPPILSFSSMKKMRECAAPGGREKKKYGGNTGPPPQPSEAVAVGRGGTNGTE